MAIETPNGYQFSEAAKIYLCADRLIASAGMAFGYPSPAGGKVHNIALSKGIIAATVTWLEDYGYIQISSDRISVLFGSRDVLVITPIASGAPGFSTRFLETTRWQPTNLIDICQRLLCVEQAPLLSFLDSVSDEFAEAGIMTRGGYAAHGNVWNPEWLAYLREAWSPEAYGLLQRANARPDIKTIHGNLMVAVAASQRSERDD